MRQLPPEPQVGDRITAELVRELIRCIRERQLLKGPNYSISTGPNGTYLKLDLPKSQISPREPLPFEVRWDATLNAGEGAWKIYLPTEHLLSYGGTYVNTSDISGATPIPDANGDDTAWSVLDDIDSSADHVWLVVTVAESSGSIVSVDAEFAAEEGQAATGENVVNICIAEVSYKEPENEGGPAVVTIKQSVVGALALGTGSDESPIVPDDVSTEFIPDPPQGQQPAGDEGKLQIKGFKAGTPHPTTTIAQDLTSTGGNAGHVLFRESDGSLSYKRIGSISIPTSTVNLTNQTVLTGLSWNTSTHKLEISSVKMTVTNGLITSWTPQQVQEIESTPISDILPTSS